jgi:hypothetical protein
VNPGQQVDCRGIGGLLPEGSRDGGFLQTQPGFWQRVNPLLATELSAQWIGGNWIDDESTGGYTAGSGLENIICGGLPGRSSSSNNSYSGVSYAPLDLVVGDSGAATESTVSALSSEAGLGGEDFDFNPMAISHGTNRVNDTGTFAGNRQDHSLVRYDEHWHSNISQFLKYSSSSGRTQDQV